MTSDLHLDLALGIDIGGTGMKAAVVDLATGELVSDRFRIDTPQPATPEAMADVVVELVAHRHHVHPAGDGLGGELDVGLR